jgi:uncharacterized protein YjbJ (UPF0337 family)
MQIGQLDLNKLRGLGDKFFGLTKETIGALTGNERWEEEGEAQQAKGTEQLRAFRKEAEAQKKEAKADAYEQKQKAAQRAKAS